MKVAEKQKNTLLENGKMLPLMEAFYTIQGEGFNTGKAAYFIRIGGCDVGCHWCDVKESWDPEIHPLTPIEKIIDEVVACPAKQVVITGGEPLMYNLEPLTKALKEKEITMFLETSGAYPLQGTFDWICLSPKKNMEPLESIYAVADELKAIIYNKHDFTWAEKCSENVNMECKLYLQPEWSKMDKMMPLIIDYVKENPKWEISLQTHKFMNIP